ncbi:hypothetical protein LUQ84_002636 [Hamiltosporidium tvaerminnensis]|nr:hypothetical protein LUQ84_002636 [Hamiltosporidium tvaerminnensis]
MLLLLLYFYLNDCIFVKFNFIVNEKVYISLNKSYGDYPGEIIGITDTWQSVLTNYCNVAEMRHIDENVYDIFFCGFKLCYDEENNILQGCIGDEYLTKWRLDELNEKEKVYRLRNNGHCINLLGNSILHMSSCDKNYKPNELLKMKIYLPPSPFEKNFGGSQAFNNSLFVYNMSNTENLHRLRSLELK